jgi:hypothetical protein
LQREAQHFSQVAAAKDVTVMQDTVSTSGLLVTGNYFELLGARPALGRLLRPVDAAVRGGEAVVVLSHETWRSRYGSDPAIVGQRISLGRQRFEVVGVAEPQARLSGQPFVTFWVPLTMAGALPGVDPLSEPDSASLVVVGRLQSGVTAASVRAWLDVWLRQRFPPPSDAAPVTVHLDSLATRLLWLPKTRSDVAGCTGLTRARLHTGDARTTTTPHTSKSPSPRTSRQVSASCGDRRG